MICITLSARFLTSSGGFFQESDLVDSLSGDFLQEVHQHIVRGNYLQKEVLSLIRNKQEITCCSSQSAWNRHHSYGK